MPASNKTEFRLDINALRAFAVLVVIAYHFGVPGFNGGFIGVDVFFVISGYLITAQIQQSLDAEKFSFSDFYVSRLRRLYPALAVICVMVLLFGWFYVFPSDYVQHAKHAFHSFYFGSNHTFSKPEGGYFDAVQTTLSPFLHTWSLSVEGQFYLIFPLMWVLIYKCLYSKQTKVVFALFLLSLAYFAYDTMHHTAQSFYSLPVRAWEFLAGALLVVLPMRLNLFFTTTGVSNTSSVIGLVCLWLSVYYLNAETLWPSGWTLIPMLGVLLLLLAKDATVTRRVFHNWFVQRTGDLSYSLYLWHWPLFVFANKYASVNHRHLNTIELVGLWSATFVLGYLSWRYVEKPIRANKKFWTAKKIVFTAFALTVIFWIGWRLLAITDGAPERLRIHSEIKQFPKELNMRSLQHFKNCPLIGIGQKNLNLCGLNTANDSNIANHLPEFLVWGDSHAHQYYPALLKAAISRNLSGVMVTKAGCRPTLSNEVSIRALENDGAACIEFNNEVNLFVEKSPSLKTVVLGRMWFDGESVSQTIKLIKSLAAKGKKVILIGAIPSPEFNVPQVWFEQVVWGRQFVHEMSVPLHKSGLPQITRRIKTELAHEISLGQVAYIDALKYFCDDSKCYYVDNGVNNFIDNNHITEAKTLEITKEFEVAFHAQ